MKTIAYNIFLSLGFLFLLSSCTETLTEQIGNTDTKWRTCDMFFDSEAPSFDSEDGTTRAYGNSWENGDMIYIHFYDGAYGKGQYSSGKWTLSYNAGLSETESSHPCTVYYVKGGSLLGTTLSLDEFSAVYSDQNASYFYSDNAITLNASLTPNCTRLRFRGKSGKNLIVKKSSGISYFSQIDYAENKRDTEGKSLSLTVKSNGYTDYIYVAPLGSNAKMTLSVDKSTFSRSLSSSQFKVGASGVYTIPTLDSYSGWSLEEITKAVLVDGKTFNSKIKTLANGTSMQYSSNDSKISKIVVNCNSSDTTGTQISSSNSGLPIYATYSDGTITISTEADVIDGNDMSYMFNGFSGLASIDLSSFDTSNVSGMSAMFNGCGSLKNLDLSNFDTSSVTSMDFMFCGCSGLTKLDLSSFNTSNVTRMDDMFYYCADLTSLDLSNFNTSNVTNMNGMFRECYGLTSLNISKFVTSKVITMDHMFYSCNKLTSLSLSQFNTSKVTDMNSMFYNCSSLTSLGVGNFDTSNVENMYAMFQSCGSLTNLDISNFNTTKVLEMTNMFRDCISLTALYLGKNFTVGSNTTKENLCNGLASTSKNCKITCMSATKNALSSGTGLNNDYITWNLLDSSESTKAILVDGKTFNSTIKTLANGKQTSYNTTVEKITNIIFDCNSSVSSGTLVSTQESGIQIYANYSNGTITISTAADIINVTDMAYMFYNCSRLTSIELSHFDTSNVTDMSAMFYGCSSLTSIELSHFDTSNVTGMGGMFEDCSSLTSLDLSHFDTSNVTSMSSMFYGCSSLTSIELSHFDTSNVTGMGGMFSECSGLTSLDLSHFDTSNVTSMSIMFSGCSSLTSIELSHFDTSNVTSMGHMFYGCSSLTKLDLSSFNTSNVKDMSCMFGDQSSGCVSLNDLDLRNFDTSNVTSMFSMFGKCSSLTKLDLSSFNTSNVTKMDIMFYGCSDLISLDLSHFDTSNVTSMGGMFSWCSSLTNLDLSHFDTSNVTDMRSMFCGCNGLTSLDLGKAFTVKNTNKEHMCQNLASNSKSCKISCISTTRDALTSGTYLNEDYITWNLLDSSESEWTQLASSTVRNIPMREFKIQISPTKDNYVFISFSKLQNQNGSGGTSYSGNNITISPESNQKYIGYGGNLYKINDIATKVHGTTDTYLYTFPFTVYFNGAEKNAKVQNVWFKVYQ